MRVCLLSVSHQNASVALREQVALSGDRLDEATLRLQEYFGGAEAVILSTCNRTELYLAAATGASVEADELGRFLAKFCCLEYQTLSHASVYREGIAAIDHLFRVASGIESMVLGEQQVLGQVKRAYERASNLGTVGRLLHSVFQDAMATAKQVRSATQIDRGLLSVGSVCVAFAKRIFERFDDKTVLGIGAGEMAKLTLRHLQDLHPGRLWIVNRTAHRAAEMGAVLGLRPPDGGARDLDELDELLVDADIVITSTGAQKPIITMDRLRPLLRRRHYRPLFIMDMAVPRDVAEDVGTLKNTYLYNIDDLLGVVSKSRDSRASQVRHGEGLIKAAVEAAMARLEKHDIGQLISALRNRLHNLGRAEQQRVLRKLAATPPAQLPEVMPDLLRRYTDRLVNKILHLPLSQLDQRKDSATLSFYATAIRHLFELDTPIPSPSGDEKMKSSSAIVELNATISSRPPKHIAAGDALTD